MNAVVDGLKARLGLDYLALAGQSGGGSIAAGTPDAWQKGCGVDVLGSGATEAVDIQYDFLTLPGYHPIKAILAKKLYDPSAHLATVIRRADRRIFALGNPSDLIVA